MNVNLMVRAGFAFGACPLIVRRALKNKSLDLSGAIAALLVGFVLTLTNLCFFLSLLVFFLSSSRLTKFRSHVKKEIEEDFKEGGQRNWVQVICNGGVACLLAIIYFLDNGSGERPIDYAHDFDASLFAIAILGAIACSCGDTWSSEIGTAFPSNTPHLITTFRKVPVGTNGGVTIIGLLASIAGGLFVGIAYYVVLTTTLFFRGKTTGYPQQWPLIVIGGSGGFIGSVVDSILGATVQYSGYCPVRKQVVNKPSQNTKHISGFPLMHNHTVNLVASAITSVAMAIFGYYLWKFIDSQYRPL